MAKPSHPAKEKVSQWISKQDDKKQFTTKAEAIKAALEHFPNEGLNAGTLGLWISGSGPNKPLIDRFAPKPRGGGDPIGVKPRKGGAITDFASLQAQIARIHADADKEAARVKQQAVKAVIAEARAVNMLHEQWANANEALEANIQLASEMTGQKPNDIKAAVDAALNS